MNLNTVEREQEIEQLRDKSIRDTEKQAKKIRFGLFSFPTPIAIGDDAMFKKRLPARDVNTGKPIIESRNVQISPPKGGKSASSYFSMQGFTTIGDLYIDPERQKRLVELKEKKVMNDVEFKPASGFKVICGGTYKHQTDLNIKKKELRDKDGKVITQPRNVVNNPIEKNLYKFRKHIADPFNRMDELKKKEREAHHSKIGEKLPFKTTIYGDKPFVKDKPTYGLDKEMKPVKVKTMDLHSLAHEVPFKPSNPPKSSHQGFLNKFPQYKPDPAREVKRIDNVKREQPQFKLNAPGNKLTRPSDSIICHPINIRREMQTIHHKL